MPGTLISGSIKFFADISEGSVQTRRQTTLGGRKRLFFSAFGVYIFGSFRNNDSVIIQYYLAPHWLSRDAKTDDLV